MKLEIFQIKHLDKCRYSFMGYDFAQRHGFNLKDYYSVFKDDTKNHKLVGNNVGEMLEEIFVKFNRNTLEDINRLNKLNFSGRSLSTSDVVKLDNKYYYCDRWGWQEIK